MTVALVSLAVILILAAVFGVVAFVTRRDFEIDRGMPTPEQARVKFEEAKKPVEEKASADVTEVENASNADLVRRARELASRK